MSYKIFGPIIAGTISYLNEIKGSLRFTDVGTSQGTIYFAGSSGGDLKALAPGPPSYILSTNGPSADPSWINPKTVTVGFFVTKSIPLFFTDTEITIGNWTTTSPIGMTINPYFNTGMPDLNLTTGLYYAPVTGSYMVDVHIEYTNTSPAHGSLKTLKFCEQSSTPANQPIIVVGPKQGTPDTSSTQTLIIHQSVELKAGSIYCIRIQASNSAMSNMITIDSKFGIVLESK